MKEEVIELSLEILHRKISQFIRNNQEKDFETFKKNLKVLTDEEEKIYNLDKDIIEKTFKVYSKELRNEENNGQ